MKNHWDVVKNEWKILYKLSIFTKSGWDLVNKTFTDGDDFWNDYLKTYPDAAQFRYKSLRRAADLDIIFGGTDAHGYDSWALNEGTLPEVVPLTQPTLDDDQMDEELQHEIETSMYASEKMQDAKRVPTSTQPYRVVNRET
ncbi:PREDICTED: L10-interacting MYB domain-containing protein-like [Nelumbo nucifera]|uniref:L10-interacting MYB domain-containing protein-like n=1 Tax=Nelumbo nucifera TaxID=4432 RepID=A0A1U8A466_NELNU|nr:PREDICTED: L10-interacting MYB domain-containing protein-like [Nelumbo nucifera]